MNRETTRKPLEALNLFSERNSETEPHHQSKPVYPHSDKSHVQLLNVCSFKKPYKCKFCPKLFSCPQRLEVHTKWHLKTPYQCRFCAHNFETAPELTKHIQTHTGIELLVCDHCNEAQKCYTFNYRRRNPRRYTCKSCGKCFSLQSILVTHLRRHVRQKTFRCKACNVRFTYAAQFRWHQTNCKQNSKTRKKDLKKKRYLRSGSPTRLDPVRRVDNVATNQVGDNLTPDTKEGVKTKITNDLLRVEQMKRFDNDAKRTKHFGSNLEQGNLEVTFENQSPFATEESIEDDKSIISSAIRHERLSGDHDSKNSVRQILSTNPSNNLPNEPCLSNASFSPFDVFRNGGNLQTSAACYPEASRQVKQELLGETSESPSKVQNLLKCSHCSRMFFFQESLDKHLKQHNKVKKHICEFCGQAFTMSSILNAHIRKHTGAMPFKCDRCELSFTYSKQLHRHQKVCYAPQQNMQTRKGPLGTVEKSKNSNAGVRFGYPSGNDIYESRISSTRGALGQAELNNIVRMFYPMDSVPPTIPKVFSADRQLSTRLANVKENENYDLNTMQQTKVEALSPPEENCLNDDVLKINTTSKSLSKSSLVPASSNQTPEIRLQVPLPGSTADVHNVANAPPTSQPQDSSKAKSKRSTSNNNPNNEKRFQCRSCGKFFSLAHNLKQHVRTHTGERPFKCDYCQARFSKSSILIVHLRRHTGEKPYGCKNCQRMFTHLTQLHRHLKVCQPTVMNLPANISPLDTARVISLGPNSFKTLTVPKPTSSFVNIDPSRTSVIRADDNTIEERSERNDGYSAENYATRLSVSSTSSADASVSEFPPPLPRSEYNSNYSVILDTQGNVYMQPETITFSC